MATLPQIISAFEEVDGRDLGSITQYGRVLRDAGLIPGGKRGMGAPGMSLEHAAILLMGIYGSFAPKDAPEAVARLRSLEAFNLSEAPRTDAFGDVAQCEKFGDALAELILAAPDIMQDAFREASPDQSLEDDSKKIFFGHMMRGAGPLLLNVTLHHLMAEIACHTVGGKIVFNQRYVVNDDLFMNGHYKDMSGYDRKVQVTFGFPTLITISAALFEPNAELTNGG